MKQGYIYLSRQLLDWEWHDEPLTGWLWVNLLLMAAYSDTKFRGVELKRGQIYTTIDWLVAQTGLSYQQLRTRLSNLEKCGCINKQTTNKFTIITICNYDSYQVPQTEVNAQTNGQLTDNQRTTNGQSTDNKKKDNKNKEDNINPPIIPPRGTPPTKKKPTPKGWYAVPDEYLAFEPAFTKWLQYKAERKQTYKSNSSLTQCLKKLIKLSNNNPATAMLIVEQSMANNWAGLFKLKDDEQTANTQGGSQEQLYNDGADLINGYLANS